MEDHTWFNSWIRCSKNSWGKKRKKKFKRNKATLKAINDAYEGKTIKCDDSQDYIPKAVW